MKAAILPAFGSPLQIGTIPDPVRGTGEVIVEVAAVPVLSYTHEVFSGARPYILPLPSVPGCGAVGRVVDVGPDATRLQAGDWVFCDPTVRSRDDALAPEIMLQGWSARNDGGIRLQQHFRHGAFAEGMMVPTENAVPIGAIDASEAAVWCALNTLLVPYGGLLAAAFQPGETLLVSGATGHFGSAAVAVALAMGAFRVVAPGRNESVLHDLEARFGERVRPVVLVNDPEKDRHRLREAAGAPIDCVLDLLPPSAPPSAVLTPAMTVRPNGRVILMGGVGGLGGAGLELPYPWLMRNNITVRGQWMYPREAVPRLVGLIRSGLLKLDTFEVTRFGLEEANRAVAHAAENGGPFRMTVLEPRR